MITRFATMLTVTKRAPGSYVHGVCVPGDNTSLQVKLDVQPINSSTAQILQALPEGRRTQDSRAVYAPRNSGITVLSAKTGAPGDLVTHEGESWMFVAEAHFDSIGGRTSHTVFIIQREIEKGAGEAPL